MLPMRYSTIGSNRAGSRTRTFHDSHSARVCSDSARTTGSNSSPSSSRCMRLVPSRGSVSGSFCRGAFARPKQLRHTRPGRGCPHRAVRLRIPFAAALCVIAGLAPLLMYVALDPERSRGQALWEWSAVGGPTIQASYRLDGLAAIGVGIGALYVAAALVATTRVSARHQLLRPVILLNGLVFITLAVTDDLIADIVVLGALAALTSFIAMLVSPAAAVARITGYLAGGVQGFVVAGLLVSRFGGASFRFNTISPDAVTPGVVVAASLGAALFAGLYPFVPWGYRSEEAGERESLRGLLTMPAGFGATLVLTRILGVTRIDLASLGLPAIISPALIAVVVAGLALRFIMRRGRPGMRRRVAIAVLVLVFVEAYPC